MQANFDLQAWVTLDSMPQNEINAILAEEKRIADALEAERLAAIAAAELKARLERETAAEKARLEREAE